VWGGDSWGRKAHCVRWGPDPTTGGEGDAMRLSPHYFGYLFSYEKPMMSTVEIVTHFGWQSTRRHVNSFAKVMAVVSVRVRIRARVRFRVWT